VGQATEDGLEGLNFSTKKTHFITMNSQRFNFVTISTLWLLSAAVSVLADVPTPQVIWMDQNVDHFNFHNFQASRADFGRALRPRPWHHPVLLWK
jgi:hypothetical protein